MLNFEKVILHNFGSYAHTELNLRDRGFCLVSGINEYEQDNASSNGSGKSFIWNAVCFALTGETLSGLRSNLKNINITEDPTCFVSVIFTEGADRYSITRHLTPKSDLKIIKNDQDLSGKGIRESEKRLTELLPDMTKNLIASAILIGQGMPNKFSSFSPSGRKELLEKLTHADFMIEDIKQRVETRLTVLSDEKRGFEDRLLSLSNEIDFTERLLSTRKAELDSLVEPDVLAAREELEKLLLQEDAIISSQDETIRAISTTVAGVSDRLFQLNTEKSNALQAITEEFEREKHKLVAEASAAKAEKASLLRQISQYESIVDTCPTCGQKLPNKVKPDTTSLKDELAIVAATCATFDEAVANHQLAYSKQFTATSAEHEARMKNLSEQYSASQKQLSTLRVELSKHERLSEKYRAQLDRLEDDSKLFEQNRLKLSTEIAQLEDQVVHLRVAKTEVTDSMLVTDEHLRVVKRMESLIRRDFRGFLLMNIIAFLDAAAKDYCQVVYGTRDLILALDGNDLSITYGGKTFDSLSGGEKQRVDLILQFAIRKLLTTYLNFSSNILVLDEITDFLDRQSCNAILKLITKELNTVESVFIVSHHAEELSLPIDSEIHIRKNSEGISEIVYGA